MVAYLIDIFICVLCTFVAAVSFAFVSIRVTRCRLNLVPCPAICSDI